jgi:uncharacterized SAM-binding protein YcdF (DUF218 family)
MSVAIVVPGHGSFRPGGRYRITDRCLRVLAAAERLAAAIEPDAVVLSGWSPVAGPSEAEQMRDAWRGPDVELVLEPTARITAQNASRSLALLLARGIDRVEVVCALPHLPRTRFFFGRLYAGCGIATGFHPVRAAQRPGAIAWELAALPLSPWQLRAARNEARNAGRAGLGRARL